MKKRIVSFVLILCLSLLLAAPSVSARSLSNFSITREYHNEFEDISPDSWYFYAVKGVFEYGIMGGVGGGRFNPSGQITVAETIRIAAILHRGFHDGSMEFERGTPWYAPYVEYAESADIPIGNFANLNAAITRADFAVIIAASLPPEALAPKNNVPYGAIPDVSETFSFSSTVYMLYRAGVLTGIGDENRFFPNRTLQRSEAAAIILRAVNADVREDLSFAVPLSAEQIYRQASPAVFYVEAFDRNDELIRTGSGFFISETGIAVTNHHVIVGANSAQVTTVDGEVWDVYGISDYNASSDIALIKVEGSDFSYLEMADSSQILTGATIYTLGSPLGLQATFSRGIVSQSFREVDNMQFIQIDAPISSGSSGGALLDAYGRVVGITTATLMGAAVVQNLNLAVPINLIHDLYAETFQTLESLIPDVESYEGFYPIPDFGKFFGVDVFSIDDEDDGIKHFYLVDDLPDDVEIILAEYEFLLAQLLFDFLAEVTVEGIDFRMFRAPYDNIVVMISVEIVNDRECVAIHMIKVE